MRRALLVFILVASLVAVSGAQAAGKRSLRDIARFLIGQTKEEAVTVHVGQRRLVVVKPDGCPDGCQVQAILGENGTGATTSGPGRRLRLKIAIEKAIRTKLRADGRASAPLEMSVTDAESGAVVTVTKTIRFRVY